MDQVEAVPTDKPLWQKIVDYPLVAMVIAGALYVLVISIAGAAARHERLAATVACKAAIKAGEELSQGEMRSLFAALRDTTLPAHDVHGRSTIVHLTWEEVERRFGRR